MKEINDSRAPSAGEGADDFCCTREAATLLRVSGRTVQQWVNKGSLRAWKTAGGHRRITMESIYKLLAARQEAYDTYITSRPSSLRKDILIVDHDQAMLRQYELEIIRWNSRIIVTTANDGFLALLQLGEQRPNLLISELFFSGIDPGAMIRSLRANSNYASMPIILTTDMGRETLQSMGIPEDIPIYTKALLFHQLKLAVEKALSL